MELGGGKISLGADVADKMDETYDQKFAQMKGYIPFLEQMIQQLESSGNGSQNPRQAQLNKIRSLRDLLLDTKKRMKMENLLKCEQVLITLYNKVELQKDTLPGIMPVKEVFPPTSSTNSDLETVRNKLRNVTAKVAKEEETLPEIARRSEIEESCTGKEPALFQRRPHRAQSPLQLSVQKDKGSPQKFSKRNYTRVLVSPEPDPQRFSIGEGSSKQLFARRSPRKSPKRNSPSYKKERKKSSRKPTNDLNITLNVPQDSLDSLSTGNILSRIINCDDNDVDIDTLRDLRSQILGDLKKIGASEDISDLLLKSYKKKKKKRFLNKKTDEVEEGELSDSESETIESIYGSLVVVDKDKGASSSSGSKVPSEKDNQSRKIQICLVINKDEQGQTLKTSEVSDFEMYNDVDFDKPTKEDKLNATSITVSKKNSDVRNEMEKLNVCDKDKTLTQDIITIDDDDETTKSELSINKERPKPAEKPKPMEKSKPVEKSKPIEKSKQTESAFVDLSSTSEAENSIDDSNDKPDESPTAFKANFYKPLRENESTDLQPKAPVSDKRQSPPKETAKVTDIRAEPNENRNAEKSIDTEKSGPQHESSSLPAKENDSNTQNTDVEIPLLNTEPVPPAAPAKSKVSEADILQALKDEILREPISIPGAEAPTPLLHQPKVTKVASAQAIVNKKRISIEKYKQKSDSGRKPSLFIKEPNISMVKYDQGRSLKLTEQECERFNFPPKLALDDSSDDDLTDDLNTGDIYSDLAPKSPEQEDLTTIGSSAPVIIPSDPIKPPTVTSKTDVDMRTTPSLLSPNSGKPVTSQVSGVVKDPIRSRSSLVEMPRNESMPEQNKRPILDPRVRREFNRPNKDSPDPYSNSDRPRPLLPHPNMTPSMNPSMTPSRAPMTPNARTYEMTPSRQPLMEFDDVSTHKHVYAPFPTFEPRERERSVGRDISNPAWEINSDSSIESRKSRWEYPEDRDGHQARYSKREDDDRGSKWEDDDRRSVSRQRDISDYHKPRNDRTDDIYRNSRNSRDIRDDYYSRQDCPRTPIHQFGRSDCPSTPIPSFGRHEVPTTPIHPFGRLDCPTTPSHPFGRSDCPTTPSHPFGRSDCPTTPSHPFGRSDCPTTPSHPFGRSDCPLTPSHSFGRSDCPLTPSHPFGRSDMPLTPSHPFGRTESPMTPSHPFGRGDFNSASMTPSRQLNRNDYQPNHTSQQKFKDPRLNRSMDESQRWDSPREYYNDRRKSDVSSQHGSDQRSYNREQSVGRNDRNKHFEQEKQRGRTPLRDSNLKPGDFGGNRYCQRRDSSENKANDSKDSRRNYQRATSVGRTYSEDTYQRASSRAPSIGRSYSNNNIDNRLSVKPQSGSTFTIDTSVNRTFQEFLSNKGLQVFDQSFEARRQRATSVGRTLTREPSSGRAKRESSVGRAVKPSPSYHDSSDYKRMVDFKRARSVGRDLVDKGEERTLKELKADFRSYSASFKKKETFPKLGPNMNNRDLRNKNDREMYQDRKPYGSSSKTVYSPRNNQRDPRMRREQQYFDNKNRPRHDKKSSSYGIVYSTDNIAKGTILGSGYGVKNYKIPKIKRPVEDVKETSTENREKAEKKVQENKIKLKTEGNKEEKSKARNKEVPATGSEKRGNPMKFEIKEKDSDKNTGKITKAIEKKDKGTKYNNRSQKNENINENTKLFEDDLKTVTRFTKEVDKEIDDSDEVPIEKRKKVKKAILESDSDSETDNKPSKSNENANKTQKKNRDENLLDSTFGIEDFELFTGNNGTAEVMANIHDLIEDLGKELESTKSAENSNGFSQELSLDNMLESMNTTENSKVESVEESFRDISELINKDLVDVNSSSNIPLSDQNSKLASPIVAEKPIQVNVSESFTAQIDESKQLVAPDIKSPIKIPVLNQEPTPSPVAESSSVANENHNSCINQSSNDVIVSTTNIKSIGSLECRDEDKEVERSSTPDSTINTCDEVKIKPKNEGVPDSTNEIQTEMNSDITSTHDASSKDTSEPSTSNKDGTPQIESIGSLLSILQDKTKIKELLSLLGGQSSDKSDKIKKKLEKLSQIVSDDEDTNDGIDQNEPEETTDSNYLPVTNEISKNEDNLEASEATEKETIQINTEKSDETEKKSEDVEYQSKTEGLDEPVPEKRRPIPAPRKPRKSKVKPEKKILSTKGKRVTRSGAAAAAKKPKVSRELRLLQDDIKEMFMSDDILNATGIRMCRLAKLVDEKQDQQNEEQTPPFDPKPVVVLEKFKEKELKEKESKEKEKPVKIRKKPGPKPKIAKHENNSDTENKRGKIKTPPVKRKPGPKSKTKEPPALPDDSDPYSFESDSVRSEATTTPLPSEDMQNSSDSENESLASSKSFGSSEVLADLKKKKRKRRSGWSAGVIVKKKKKTDTKQKESIEKKLLPELILRKKVTYPDMSCFVDRNYCFYKEISIYPCRLCDYSGNDIVHHYKKQHPHFEIPLSRVNAAMAHEAIYECEDIDFNAMSRTPSDKYICRFCFKEFIGKKSILEQFFWHVVSMHTGEYKQTCSICVNSCSYQFNLDIPPPPKDVKGQLIGYICGKCNFTQISLENLKSHVSLRHDDEQTEVFAINLGVMTKKSLNALLTRQESDTPRMLRSGRVTRSVSENGDDVSDDLDNSETTDISECTFESKKESNTDLENQTTPKLPVQSKLTFESDETLESNKKTTVKIERNDDIPETQAPVSDILDYPHFKVCYNSVGAKEYICCINGNHNHYKTALLISMKKHIQTKHTENWDGYCFVCKVIVMPQGKHSFRDCLQHLLDKHIDSIPVLESSDTPKDHEFPVEHPATTVETPQTTAEEDTSASKPKINVRPLSDLISKDVPATADPVTLPKIQNVVSLDATTVEPPTPSPAPEDVRMEEVPVERVPKTKPVEYEEAQAKIISKKHRVVLDAMLVPENLVKIFKCAGRFCSFTTDSAESALVHASTHQRIGGENALLCAYCDCDCKENAIDLITHVFKNHAHCQFNCAYCFYRAAASQLVRAHMNRVHGAQHMNSVVYHSSVVVSSDEDKVGVLPRSQTVQYYVCTVADCKFRTFTHGKYADHLAKHEPPYACHVCQILTLPTALDLIQHLKSHGLMLYQCVFCIHGAENENELLAHASAKHPSKTPQAYLRVITHKDGDTSKMMVLPLAQLNKSTVKVLTIPPDHKPTDPAREAERSIDLEKLIGSVSALCLPAMDTTVTTATVPNTETSVDDTSANDPDFDLLDQTSEEPISTRDLDMATLIPEPPRVVTPPPTTSAVIGTESDNTSLTRTPVLKTEPPDEISTKDKFSSTEIICLDTDEEDSTESSQNIINLDDEIPASVCDVTPDDDFEKIPLGYLYKCPNCLIVYKTPAAFKRHVATCLQKASSYSCAHCTKIASNIDELLAHYSGDHGNFPKLRAKRDMRQQNYICGVCDLKNSSLFFVKSHLKNIHGISNVIVASKLGENGMIYTVREAPGSKAKRKLSAGSSAEPAPKRKRYGPSDLNQLPTRPIFDEPAFCSECEFSTKVLLNLVRHLQQHADAQAVPSSVPVNPVPHLETNEKHFDKMINLASSSLVNKPDKPSRSDNASSGPLLVPPETAMRYPKYVSDRQRYTCGAKDCSYISVDEDMLRCHWETLHEGTNNFHCVHCPANQLIDNTKPLTAPRIIAHLKMHDANLYACSSCSYYHHRKLMVERHLAEIHKGAGQALIVREEGIVASTSITIQPPAAPTMDLKPWQCGLCKYKSMLRQEVMEHCSKNHNSKWQFRCPNCPFRGSTIENVSNHQSRVHPESKEEIFYYYYREGSISEPDGIPKWQKQRQKMNLEEVKTETTEAGAPVPAPPPIAQKPPSASVNLNIVKQEVPDVDMELQISDLCKKFGQCCDPNGLKYKCPLCKIVTEDDKITMQSHLYEELQYRKWACNICSYKAFHKTGLNEHMSIEHFRQAASSEPMELPLDVNIEKWVAYVLRHQTDIIAKNKENFAKQKIQMSNSEAGPSVVKPNQTTQGSFVSFTGDENSEESLKQAFGDFGSAKNVNFCCPKCFVETPDEITMKNHLELELNKIRWRCSNCNKNSQKYHEAQLHCKTCKSLRPGQSARPVEAIRDPAVRANWVAAVMRHQKASIKIDQSSTSNSGQMNPFTVENSLLAVRFEKTVPTPEEEMRRRNRGTPTSSTAPSADNNPDSDDDRLVIDEPPSGDPPEELPAEETLPAEAETSLKKKEDKKCPYCDFTSKHTQSITSHTYRHYNLRPWKCIHCDFNSYPSSMKKHFAIYHPGMIEKYEATPLPSGPPLILKLVKRNRLVLDRRASSAGDSISGLQSDEEKTNEAYTKDFSPYVPRDNEERAIETNTKNIDPNDGQKELERPKEDGAKVVCLVCERNVSESEKSSHTHDNGPVSFAKKGDVVVKCCICLALLPDGVAMKEHHNTNHSDSSINYAYYKISQDHRDVMQYCCHCRKGFKYVRDLRAHHNAQHSSLPLKYETRTPPFDAKEQEGASCSEKTGDDVLIFIRTSRGEQSGTNIYESS